MGFMGINYKFLESRVQIDVHIPTGPTLLSSPKLPWKPQQYGYILKIKKYFSLANHRIVNQIFMNFNPIISFWME